MNFALIGAAGYIAPRHMKAIRDTNNRLIAAFDPHDSVGIIDSFFPNASFFTEIERFDRHLDKTRRNNRGVDAVDYVAVCSPNYLHDAHCRLALRTGADAICEKPLVINPWNLDQLRELEDETGHRVLNVLQLRLHPAVQALKEQTESESTDRKDICLTYVTRRGKWYHHSWKGDASKSGGVAMNIGVHFFDFLLWLYGGVNRSLLHLAEDARMSGILELEKARVRWFLSVDEADLPDHVRSAGGHAYRSLTVDDQELDLSTGFTDLHTEVYRDILAGGGYGLDAAQPAIELVYQLRHSSVVSSLGVAHPYLTERRTGARAA